MFIYVYILTCTCIYTYISIYSYTHHYICSCMWTYVYEYLHVKIHWNEYTWEYIWSSMLTFVPRCSCICDSTLNLSMRIHIGRSCAELLWTILSNSLLNCVTIRHWKSEQFWLIAQKLVRRTTCNIWDMRWHYASDYSFILSCAYIIKAFDSSM